MPLKTTHLHFSIYDGDGRRVKAAEGGLTTVYIGDYYEWRSDSTTTTQVKYYYAGGTRVSMRSNGVLTWLLGDRLGSTTITATENGTLASEQKYTAWGQTRSGSVGTDRQYTGQINEAQLGIYFYSARYYDPLLGRFISADSIIPQPGSPLAWDRYSYVYSNPVNFTDPSGFCRDDDIKCKERLKLVEQRYGVGINDENQLWTLDALNAISLGMATLEKALGKNRFIAEFEGVTFTIEAGNGMWTWGFKDIEVGDQVLDNFTYISTETIHELAHIMDDNCNDCYSTHMMELTGSKYKGKGIFSFITGKKTYLPSDDPPTKYAGNSHLEDWAESVTAVLVTDYAEISPWSPTRQSYIKSVFARNSRKDAMVQ